MKNIETGQFAVIAKHRMFRLLPLLMSALAMAFAVNSGCRSQVVTSEASYDKINIAGDPPIYGFYDPSVQYGPNGEVGWLAYSSVTGQGNPFGPYVHTNLAKSLDHGATWQFVQRINNSADDLLVLTDGQSLAGVWRYEVPSLVYTPNDAGREWKLFAHKYFWNSDNDRMFAYGWLVYRWASDPAGKWSEEVPLFGAGKYPPAPYHKTRIDLNALDPNLSHIVAYSEPGALFADSRLYLGLTAASLEGPERLILVVSEDGGDSWKFAGTLSTNDDARALNYKYLDGLDLVVEGGRTFLLVAPCRQGQMYDGTLVFEFENLAAAKLKRDSKGNPAVLAHILPQLRIISGLGAGQSTYDQFNFNGGIILPQFNLIQYPEVFQIFNTHLNITGSPTKVQ